MKLSLAWIFDHLDADWRSIDVKQLVQKFNRTVAEIEHVRKVDIDLENVTLVQVRSCDEQKIMAYSAEWDNSYPLPARSDAIEKSFFIAIKENNNIRWAKSTDFGAEKEMILPAVSCPADQQDGTWKKNFESCDWILDIDNKSITNRPDLWGHRGLAREIALMLNLRLKPLSEFLVAQEIQEFSTYESKKNNYPISITLANTHACKRFAGILIPEIANQASLVWMTSRLSRVNSKAINAIVDFTNYVMLDVSQPMHAFDANKIGTRITVRNALPKEKLLLLDSTTVELTSDDVVVADEKNALALAGIMGGMQSSITANTTSLFLESASFSAVTIRQTATRLKLRTEASARFEKTLNPNQNTDALCRFLKLVQDANIVCVADLPIVSVGQRAQGKTIEITHAFIESRIGAKIDAEFIGALFEKLDFTVHKENKDNTMLYIVTVPPSRSTKDITIKEDLVEEVARFFGYESIPYIFPQRTMRAFDITTVMQLRKIKQIMAWGLCMRELQQYAFYDEQFLKLIQWKPEKALEVLMPVSENFKQLVTSLMPNLFKAVHDHSNDYQELRFFEWGRIWNYNATTQQYDEKKSLAGIIFHQKRVVDFHQAKADLENLFYNLKLRIQWKKIESTGQAPWFDPIYSADLFYDHLKIGTAGVASAAFFESVATGYAFIFELDADFLLNYQAPIALYKAASKYPAIERDISMLLPLECTAQEVINSIQSVDERISTVQVVDFFQKKEWIDQKALTARFVLTDYNKTLTKQEADVVVEHIITQLQNLGATIR